MREGFTGTDMTEAHMKRRLAAILIADIVGYSRLMEEDESATLDALKDRRATLIDPLISEHNGRIVKLMGDGTLAEFTSVSDAVRCAVVLQQHMFDRNIAGSEGTKIELRIGINLGDVIPDGEDIYGEGVNVAARLEKLAQPGGICISGTVHDAIGRELAARFEFIGDQTVKNIAKPVRAYQQLGSLGEAQIAQKSPNAPPVSGRSSAPSLAVKPFENLSSDPEQESFVDAMSNGILVALTRLPGLILVQDESPQLARSKQMSDREIAGKFGVQFLIKGDLRKFGHRGRLSVQLVEVSTGQYRWAEKFDLNLSDVDDLFEVQDEITEQIVTALDVNLLSSEAARLVRKSLRNPTARDCYARGEHVLWSATSSLELHSAQHLFEETIRLEPDSSVGYATAALSYWIEALSGNEARLAEVQDLAERRAREAIARDDVTGYPHLVLAQLHLSRREFEQARTEAECAVSARPSCPAAYALKASVLNYLGHLRDAIEHAEFAMRLTPVHPPMYPATLAGALYSSARYDEAISSAQTAIELDRRSVESYTMLAASNIALGRGEEARRTAAIIKVLQPDFTLSKFADTQPYKDQDRLDRLLEHLRQAGLE